jgi:hypothetical protein
MNKSVYIFLMASCTEPSRDSGDEAPDCSRPCIDSPYHRCGEYVAVAESLSCSALAVGIAMDDWSAYSVEVDGLPVDVIRRDGVLTGTCDGSALVRRWSVSDEPGCALVESVPQSCEALSAGLLWDRDVTGWSVEAITSEGDVLISDAYTVQTRLYGSCPDGASMASVVGVLPDLGLVGEQLWP